MKFKPQLKRKQSFGFQAANSVHCPVNGNPL